MHSSIVWHFHIEEHLALIVFEIGRSRDMSKPWRRPTLILAHFLGSHGRPPALRTTKTSRWMLHLHKITRRPRPEGAIHTTRLSPSSCQKSTLLPVFCDSHLRHNSAAHSCSPCGRASSIIFDVWASSIICDPTDRQLGCIPKQLPSRGPSCLHSSLLEVRLSILLPLQRLRRRHL